MGSLVKAERSGQNQFFHYDWRGSVVALTDAAEQAIKSYTYDAFGDVTTSSGSAVNPYQFSGKQFDPNSGLSYFGRRHYSAQLGRFITQDPKEYVDGLNTYAYVKNNPVNWIDNLGLACGPEGWDWIIPDRPGGFDFEGCCQDHDDCYGTCGADKGECDANFLDCLLDKCAEYPENESTCDVFANTYWMAVAGAGGAAFRSAQRDACGEKKEMPSGSNGGGGW